MQSNRTVLTQEQRQTLSHQMLQSIRIMAMPIQELKETINAELEKNPALEVIYDPSVVSLDSIRTNPEIAGTTSTQQTETNTNYEKHTKPKQSHQELFEKILSNEETLQEHLLEQLRIQPVSESILKAGELLIQNLDDKGFHIEDSFVVCKDFPQEDVHTAIDLIQHLEPIGTCTRNFQESLIVQAKLDPAAPPYAQVILERYFDLLEHNKTKEIQKLLKIDQEELEHILTYIKTLNPFPGRQYAPNNVRYITPDVIVRRENGDFIITINEEEFPVLSINPYFNTLLEKQYDRATTLFVKENVRKAQEFIQSIQQRNKTLLRVVRALIDFQRAFFIKGPRHLAPLTLKDIAQHLELHESTISRLVNGKFIQTDYGIFELRYFFSNSISGAGSTGSRYAQGAVKEIIKEIIQNEPDALSDQAIAEKLALRGIQIARRTVAKYRKMLQLDSSFERKGRKKN